MRFDDGTSCEWFWLFDGEAVELVERPAQANPALGLVDLGMAKKIDRLLEAHGLHLTVKRDSRNWGDQVEVSVVPLAMKAREKGKKR